MNRLQSTSFGVARVALGRWPHVLQATIEGSFEGLSPHPKDIEILRAAVVPRLEAGLETCVLYRLRDAEAQWVEEWSIATGDARLVIVRPAPSGEAEPSRAAWLGSLRHDLSNQQFLLRTTLAGLEGSAVPVELADVRADIEHIALHCAGVIRTLEEMVGRHDAPASVDLASFLTKNLGLLRRVADPHTVAIDAPAPLQVTLPVEALRAALVTLVAIANVLSAEEHVIEVAARVVESSARLSVALVAQTSSNGRADLELSALNRALHGLARELGSTVEHVGGVLSLSFASRA